MFLMSGEFWGGVILALLAVYLWHRYQGQKAAG